MWGTGRCGGNRAIFEVANRLFDRGYKVNITALSGNHRWFNLKVPVNYITISSKLLKTIHSLYNIYRLLKFRDKDYGVTAIAEGIANKLGFHIDLIRVLSESLPEANVHIATYYPTALAVWLANTASKRFYFLQDFPELVEEVGGSYGLKLFELTLRMNFDYFLCNSNYTKSLVERYQPEARTLVTGVGVNTEVFRPRRENILSDIKDRFKVMVMLRGLKYKGDEIAIKALSLVSKKIPIHTVIVSDKAIAKKLLTKERGSFSYTIYSNVDDDTLAKLYSSVDVFLFTSYAEGFGLPPLEAMACGTPVVTTDCKGNRDYLINGYNSIVVPPGDPQALANAIIKIFNNDNLREKLIEGGLKTAKEWTWDRVINKIENILKDA